MIRSSNTCSKTWNRATIATYTSQSPSTHERSSRDTLTHAYSRHARTHARLVRTTLVRSLDFIGATPQTWWACEKTNERWREARRGEGTRQISVLPVAYHCPRIPAELWVHGNKGKCASPIGSDRSTETVNPVAIYVAVISIMAPRTLSIKIRPFSLIER